MCHHAEAEHQNYRVPRKCDYTCAVQDIENTVVAEVDNKRIDGIIAGFAKPHKDVVDNCTARIRNIKRNMLYNDTENLSCILKPLRIAEEWCPCGNGNHPKHRTCSGNKVIVEFTQRFVPVLAVRADNLGKGCDRYEQPAPDKLFAIQ